MTHGNASWVVHKFGGTSLANAERMRAAAGIVRAELNALPSTSTRMGVVVSAMAGVTNALFDLCERAARRDPSWSDALRALVAKHRETLAGLSGAAGTGADAVGRRIESDAADIEHLLRAVSLLGQRTESIDEVIAGHGEVWSAQMFAAHLGVPWVDARRVLVVRPSEMGPVVDEDESRRRTRALVDGAEHAGARIVVITGYVASTPEGVPTTLKRNGSDFSASIFGALLDASTVTIWTDVDGVLSADPRRVPEAVLIDEMSYEEAMELAYFGAKVVHPRTMQPAVERAIPIWIRNTFRPQLRGSVIQRAAPASGPTQRAVKGFTTIDDIALVNVEGTGMVGVPGVAERLFAALRRAGVSVVVISQASSEHSICFAVPERQADAARAAVDDAFAEERARHIVSNVEVQRGCSILAAVGDAMALQPGVAARFFGALADAGVNVRAIAQGSSERNLTAVIDGASSTRALRAVHAKFTLSDLAISVGVVGPGLIGRELLAQIASQRAELKRRARLDLRVRAIANRQRMVLGDDIGSADAGDANAMLRTMANGDALDWDALARHIRAEHLPHAIIVDCSASDDVADRYPEWLRRGIHVVTPNKRAASGPIERWRAIESAAAQGRARYCGEATVGAGLPVLTTLRDLVHTGDDVRAVEGILSGTLSWIFNTLGKDGGDGRAFSSLVREAKALGYTEPDPRDDLSGRDFARKLVVLAREMGRDSGIDDVDIEDLAPGLAFGLPLEELLAGLAGSVDAVISARQRAARSEGRVLRYVGVVPESGRLRVSLEALPASHPFARLDGTDNVLAFRTRRYAVRPLVVQGPGAGAEVTAGGVFGDILRVAAQLGAAV